MSEEVNKLEQTNWDATEDGQTKEAKALIVALVKKLNDAEEEPLKDVLRQYYGELIGQKRPVAIILGELNQVIAMKIVDCHLVFAPDVAAIVKKLMTVAEAARAEE